MAVFGKPRPKRTLKTIITEILNRINDNTMRLRRIEQASQSSAMRIDSIEENFLETRKKLEKEIADLKNLLSINEKKIAAVEKNMQEVVEHIKRMPKAEKLAEIEQLIEIYNPLKSNFITKEEVERLIEKKR